MMKFLKYFALLATLIPIGYLQAMEQQQLENPFQALNDDPQCPLRFVRYEPETHNADLKRILASRLEMRFTTATQELTVLNSLSPECPTGASWHTPAEIIEMFELQSLKFSHSFRHYMIQSKQHHADAVGFINWQTSPSLTHDGSAYINRLALCHEHRRKGLGTLALYAVLKYEQLHGAQEIQTEMYKYDRNTLCFFEKIGFKKLYIRFSKNSDHTWGFTMQLNPETLNPLLKNLQDRGLISTQHALCTRRINNANSTLNA